MTVVRLPRLVMAVGRVGAPLPAFGRLYRLLLAARDRDLAGPAVARHLLGLRARVTRPRVAPEIRISVRGAPGTYHIICNAPNLPGLTFVVLAVEGL